MAPVTVRYIDPVVRPSFDKLARRFSTTELSDALAFARAAGEEAVILTHRGARVVATRGQVRNELDRRGDSVTDQQPWVGEFMEHNDDAGLEWRPDLGNYG